MAAKDKAEGKVLVKACKVSHITWINFGDLLYNIVPMLNNTMYI